MSPTLLELVIVVLILLLSWLIAPLIARWLYALLSFLWRMPKQPPSASSTQRRTEKNVTPSPAPNEKSR